MTTLKTCFKCGIEKSLDAFYKDSRMVDGHLGKCKECAKKDARTNYRRHIEQYRAYERGRAMLPHRIAARTEYQHTADGKAAIRRAHVRFCQHNPIKRAAHILCDNAIRGGRLKRMPCEVCGSELAQAHHDDYSKPLAVRWLCTRHHSEWHKHNTPLCPDQSNSATTATFEAPR